MREFDRLHLIDRLLPVFIEVLQSLAKLELSGSRLTSQFLHSISIRPGNNPLHRPMPKIREAIPTLKIMLATYFGELRDNAPIVTALPIDVLHIDLTRADKELDSLPALLPSTLSLSVALWMTGILAKRLCSFIQTDSKGSLSPRRIQSDRGSILLSPAQPSDSTARTEARLRDQGVALIRRGKTCRSCSSAHLGTTTEDAAAVAEPKLSTRRAGVAEGFTGPWSNPVLRQ